jgi:hypothetical protein
MLGVRFAILFVTFQERLMASCECNELVKQFMFLPSGGRQIDVLLKGPPYRDV